MPRAYTKPFVPWATGAVAAVACAVVAGNTQIMGNYVWTCAVMCLKQPDFFVDFSVLDLEHPQFGGFTLYLLGMNLYALIHSSWVHLGRNVASLIVFGWFVERFFVQRGYGRRQYVAFLWAMSLIAGAAMNIWNTSHGQTSAHEMGMSGVIMALAGFFFVAVRAPFWIKVTLGAHILMVVDGDIGNMVFERIKISSIGHAAGLLAGLVAGAIWANSQKERVGYPPHCAFSERFVSAMGYLLVPVAVVSFFFAKARHRPFLRVHSLQSVMLWIAIASAISIAVAIPRVYPFEVDVKYWAEGASVYVSLALVLGLSVKAFVGAASTLPVISRLCQNRHPEGAGIGGTQPETARGFLTGD